MENKKQSSRKEISELENPYFDLQAEMGFTKHLGGLKATRELIELCHINEDKYVLDVGCGVGMTACYIAKKYGCRVVGVDIHEEMISRSTERAKREGVEGRVEFQVADAQNLLFEDALFDAVISESATAFPEDKREAISEYVRVTKQGGYIGLNESTWIKTLPPTEVVEYLFRSAGGVEPETSEGWKELLEGSGLSDIVVKTYNFPLLGQFVSDIRMVGFTGIFKACGRLLSLYFKNSTYRKAIKEMAKGARGTPKNLLEYYGYGIYVGRK
ncbi:MAG: class I SAM-dependent methyltransferase [Methanophagales archaeon]|nr:class I SAM-dependent methyltransferase [Methanophagales archaeon]